MVREWFQGGVIGGEGVRGRWEREEGVEEGVRCGVVEDMRGEQYWVVLSKCSGVSYHIMTQW